MGVAVNLTPHAIAELVTRDAAGDLVFVVAVKATFSWGAAPGAELVAVDPRPIAGADRYAGDPAASGLVAAAEIGLAKPRVDVLLEGELRFPSPVEETLVSLEVGTRLAKRVKVFGERRWIPAGTGAELIPSRAAAVAALPIAWERSCGGTAAGDPPRIDRRNPVGCTEAREPRELQGKPLPNFEDPGALLRSARDRPAPCGFGPVAPHWEPRVRLAGTYDQRWSDTRSPLVPEDFDRAYFNAAPADQQLPDYRAGEEVRLAGLAPRGRVLFHLPPLDVPVMFVSRVLMEETRARVDTIVIEPEAERVSLIARAVSSPLPSAVTMRQIFVGPLSRGRRRALETGRLFLDYRAAQAAAP